MSAAAEERVERVPMSLEDYLALPEGVRAEWVDGVALMTPQPNLIHNLLAGTVRDVLKAALPALVVAHEVGISMVRSRRVADVVVLPRVEDAVWPSAIPILVAEVISPSSRTEDRVRKLREYAAAGIAYYLIVDRFERTLVGLRNVDGDWAVELDLSDAAPAGELVVGEHGTVGFDLEALFTF